MKKVYVIGIVDVPSTTEIEQLKRNLEITEDVEIICVKSIEDVPIRVRLSSDPSLLQEIHTISQRPILPQMTLLDTDKKRKGHERPYKYHP